MVERLPQREGEWIDRTRPVVFRFEGRSYTGLAGDTLTSALWANGVRRLGRSFKYHRPRGPVSLANHDINVMVEDAPGALHRRTNLRGDVLPLEESTDVYAVNTAGGLEGDRLRITQWFARFLPVGFYYKAFYSPRWLFPFYEQSMRRVAGLGRMDPAVPAGRTSKCYDFCDVLVVGAGPAGLSAALAAAEQGARVLVVDEQPKPGGGLTYHYGRDLAARDQFARLLGAADRLANLEVRLGTVAQGCYGDLWIALTDDRKLTKLRTRALVVATGVFEQLAVFHNNDLPGVMLGSAVQRLIRLFAVKPFHRAVILTANLEGYRVALDLHDAGVKIAAVADLREHAQPSELMQQVTDAGITVYQGYTVYEASAGTWNRSVDSAVLCRLDERGQPQADTEVDVPCDGIVMSVGWAPAGGLVYQAGGRFSYSNQLEQFVPSTLPDGVFTAGRVNGIFELAEQIADGELAGQAAATFTGHAPTSTPPLAKGGPTKTHVRATVEPVENIPPPSHPYPIFDHPHGKNFVDLDEDIHLADFHHAHQEGYDNIELMKRYTTFGMGASQGKLANMNVVRILARLNGESIDQTSTTTSRPFHHPVPLGHLAGRRFHPARRTPMHEWHEKAGAQFMYVGPWLRPEYYAPKDESRDVCILDEARQMRQNVGLIDVGTLGKIEVSGPDSVAFLERIYTGKFARQPVGRIRYALACDESGVIIEDGVIARLAEDRFYVTATTSGVLTFFRELQRWALLWRLNVVLVNATGHWTAMNIAGPRSREVLSTLTDLALSPEAFPYLGVREGSVLNGPARVIRVGFVGELGYEIHVPASRGLHVWSTLMSAGRDAGIRPVGVEAQRLLRLEKGHLIVGQDTDALTHPYEANLAWTIGKNKPFFIGQRSLAILQKQPAARRLVGIAFPHDYKGTFPEECHLVIDGDQIGGRITSIAKRSTLGRVIGLAFVQPSQDSPGTAVQIRVDGGNLVTGEVTTIPFYDPQNARQDA